MSPRQSNRIFRESFGKFEGEQTFDVLATNICRLGRHKHISRWVDRENLIYVRGNSIKTLSEVKPIKNISKNPQSFLEICSGQKGVLPSHKTQNHVYEKQKPFRFKEDNPSDRMSLNQLSHPSLSHIERECQAILIQGKNQQNSNKGLEHL